MAEILIFKYWSLLAFLMVAAHSRVARHLAPHPYAAPYFFGILDSPGIPPTLFKSKVSVSARS